VKKIILLSAGLMMFLSSCALLQHKPPRISWPEQVRYIEAMCELDMSWKGMKYRGSMSLTMDYPEKLRMEVYGPFGDTVLLLKRDGTDFLLSTRDERFTDAGLFERRFGIKLREFMDDLAMVVDKEVNDRGESFVQREDYRVVYSLKDDGNTICWQGKDGSICVSFLEVKFDSGESLEEGNNPSV